VAYRLLADAVVVAHFGFIVFVAAGGLLAWRWPRLMWAHVPAVAWGAGIVAVGYECPLTPLEKWLRGRGGESEYGGGFVDRYIEDVIYPDEYTPLLRAVVALLVVVGWAGLVRRRRSARGRSRAGLAPVTGRTPPATRPRSSA
jgi:hypothetical protein